MTIYTIEGSGAQTSGRIEKTAATATAALALYYEIHRLCGKSGAVEIWADQGRRMTPDTLQSRALAEQTKSRTDEA